MVVTTQAQAGGWYYYHNPWTGETKTRKLAEGTYKGQIKHMEGEFGEGDYGFALELEKPMQTPEGFYVSGTEQAIARREFEPSTPSEPATTPTPPKENFQKKEEARVEKILERDLTPSQRESFERELATIQLTQGKEPSIPTPPKEKVVTIGIDGKAIGVSPGVAEKLEKEVIPRQEHAIKRAEQIKKGIITPAPLPEPKVLVVEPTKPKPVTTTSTTTVKTTTKPLTTTVKTTTKPLVTTVKTTPKVELPKTTIVKTTAPKTTLPVVKLKGQDDLGLAKDLPLPKPSIPTTSATKITPILTKTTESISKDLKDDLKKTTVSTSTVKTTTEPFKDIFAERELEKSMKAEAKKQYEEMTIPQKVGAHVHTFYGGWDIGSEYIASLFDPKIKTEDVITKRIVQTKLEKEIVGESKLKQFGVGTITGLKSPAGVVASAGVIGAGLGAGTTVLGATKVGSAVLSSPVTQAGMFGVGAYGVGVAGVDVYKDIKEGKGSKALVKVGTLGLASVVGSKTLKEMTTPKYTQSVKLQKVVQDGEKSYITGKIKGKAKPIIGKEQILGDVDFETIAVTKPSPVKGYQVSKSVSKILTDVKGKKTPSIGLGAGVSKTKGKITAGVGKMVAQELKTGKPTYVASKSMTMEVGKNKYFGLGGYVTGEGIKGAGLEFTQQIGKGGMSGIFGDTLSQISGYTKQTFTPLITKSSFIPIIPILPKSITSKPSSTTTVKTTTKTSPMTGSAVKATQKTISQDIKSMQQKGWTSFDYVETPTATADFYGGVSKSKGKPGIVGFADIPERITIQEGLPKDLYESTLEHETLHMVYPEKTEKQIRELELSHILKVQPSYMTPNIYISPRTSNIGGVIKGVPVSSGIWEKYPKTIMPEPDTIKETKNMVASLAGLERKPKQIMPAITTTTKTRQKEITKPVLTTTNATQTQKQMEQQMKKITGISQTQSILPSLTTLPIMSTTQIQTPIRATRRIPLIRTGLITEPRMDTLLRTEIITPPTPIPPYPVPLSFGKKPKKIRPSRMIPAGFDVDVRKAGKWIRVSGQPLLRQEARKLGAMVTEKTPRASFRLVPSKRRPSPRRVPFYFKQERFRKPVRRSKLKGLGEIWIEKSKYRIDQPKELKGITLKGLQTPRKKSRKKSKSKKKRPRKRNIWGF